MSKTQISAERPGGFRDYLPGQVQFRLKMIETIRGVFERFGFEPLETSAIEYFDVLTGGDDMFDMALYEAKRTRGERLADDVRRTALRFDLTVPLARVVAEYGDLLPRPFKRYQVGNVWRGEKPQAGRFREFMQFDADTVGTASMMADAEIVWLMYETLKALGVERFVVRFNNRKILNGLPAYVGFPDADTNEVLRILDKSEKIGAEEIRAQLIAAPKPVMTREEVQEYDRWLWSLSPEDQEKEKNRVYGPGLSEEAADRVMAFVAITGSTDEILDKNVDIGRGNLLIA